MVFAHVRRLLLDDTGASKAPQPLEGVSLFVLGSTRCRWGPIHGLEVHHNQLRARSGICMQCFNALQIVSSHVCTVQVHQRAEELREGCALCVQLS